MPAASTLPASVVARLTTDRAAAQAIGDALAESFDAAEVAAASVEEADGRWSLENTLPGMVHFEMEHGDGRPSRWNTLRAMRVLRWASKGVDA